MGQYACPGPPQHGKLQWAEVAYFLPQMEGQSEQELGIALPLDEADSDNIV